MRVECATTRTHTAAFRSEFRSRLTQMQLDLAPGHINALLDKKGGNLNSDSGIEACTSAAEALQEAMEVELPTGGWLLKLTRSAAELCSI